MSDSCNPMNSSLSGSSVHGILLARILEWVAISFSRLHTIKSSPSKIYPMRHKLLVLFYRKNSVIEFIDLVTTDQRESSINTLDTTLATMEVIDEIRRQLGVTYPADL